MPTSKARLNLTLEDATMKIIGNIAKRDNVSLASVAKELILRSLEDREDIALSKIAELRIAEGLEEVISHDDAWK